MGVASNPRCAELLSKFLEIQVDMQELNTSLRERLANTQRWCYDQDRDINAQIREQETYLGQHEAELAFAIETVQNVKSVAKERREDFETYSGQLLKTRGECSESLKNLE